MNRGSIAVQRAEAYLQMSRYIDPVIASMDSPMRRATEVAARCMLDEELCAAVDRGTAKDMYVGAAPCLNGRNFEDLGCNTMYRAVKSGVSITWGIVLVEF